MQDYQIIPIPAFKDNYIWLICYQNEAVVVDPGEAAPVLAMLKKLQLNLSAILITHHHADHIGGVQQLLNAFPNAQTFAPSREHYPFKHTTVGETTFANISLLNLDFKVIDCAGHTTDHVAYLTNTQPNQSWLFCGDVIFAAGCGYVPEGWYQYAYQSIKKIATLPTQTQVFCAHEYTLNNLQFALALEPQSMTIQARLNQTQHMRALGQITLPTTLDLELKTNPYLRCDDPYLKASLQIEDASPLEVFTHIRKLKNQYKSTN